KTAGQVGNHLRVEAGGELVRGNAGLRLGALKQLDDLRHDHLPRARAGGGCARLWVVVRDHPVDGLLLQLVGVHAASLVLLIASTSSKPLKYLSFPMGLLGKPRVTFRRSQKDCESIGARPCSSQNVRNTSCIPDWNSLPAVAGRIRSRTN